MGASFARLLDEAKVEGLGAMGDSVMLACAVLASLAAGVLVAYAVCLGVFAMFRTRVRQVAAEPAVRIAGSTSIVEG